MLSQSHFEPENRVIFLHPDDVASKSLFNTTTEVEEARTPL